MGRKNTLCVDEGYVEIENDIDCKKGIESRGWDYGGVRNKSYGPRGCNTAGLIYNIHPVGGRHGNVAPICITPGNTS